MPVFLDTSPLLLLVGMVIAQDQSGFLTALPIISSAVVAVGGLYVTILIRRDNRRKDAVAAEAAEASQKLEEEKGRIDTLTLGQEWVVAALDRTEKAMERTEKDNERLRAENTNLRAQIAELRDEIASLKRQMGLIK